MKNILIIIALLSLSVIGCKVETVAPAQYPQAQAPKPAPETAQKDSPTFMQCADAGWTKTKEVGGEAYEAAAPVVKQWANDAEQAYDNWKKEHDSKKDDSSSEP